MISTLSVLMLMIYQVYHSKQPLTFDHNPFVRCLTSSFFFQKVAKTKTKKSSTHSTQQLKKKKSSQDFPIPKRTFTPKKKRPRTWRPGPSETKASYRKRFGPYEAFGGVCNFVYDFPLNIPLFTGFIHPNGGWE